MLRHRPDEFGLNVDPYGFAPLEQVMQAVRERYPDAALEEVEELTRASDQRRFELQGDRIRALYGHSYFVEMDGEPMAPPELLYMGATAAAARRYAQTGIKPADRFYVHLSLTRETAAERSHEDAGPVVVEILAGKAAAAGTEFYERGCVVLTRSLAAEFVGQIWGLEAAAASSSAAAAAAPAPAVARPPVAVQGPVTYGRRLRKGTRR